MRKGLCGELGVFITADGGGCWFVFGETVGASMSWLPLPVFLDRLLHFQTLISGVLLLVAANSIGRNSRSAQYPSGYQTYSYPSLGGRGGSRPYTPRGELPLGFRNSAPLVDGTLLNDPSNTVPPMLGSELLLRSPL